MSFERFQFPQPANNLLPHQIQIVRPPIQPQNESVLNRIKGSLVGLAIGDALGACVEFRPHDYLAANPVQDMMGGGTWGLQAGQWTDDTSMALCLASSLITHSGYNPYDQMVRYKWWYKSGYLSSTGKCFDIGKATRESLEEFSRRQTKIQHQYYPYNSEQDIDRMPWEHMNQLHFDVNCSREGVAGNGALMRLAPVPLFFHRDPLRAVEFSGRSARLTHGAEVAVDACRYYGALIVAAVNGESKDNILSGEFCTRYQQWFGSKQLHQDILKVARGSFKKEGGYKDGIRGKGYVVPALEAALWAFWSTGSFEDGALKAVNLGDDTDTTAAIYGQLAGAFYGFSNIPKKWIEKLYARDLIICMAEWLQFLPSSASQPVPVQPRGVISSFPMSHPSPLVYQSGVSPYYYYYYYKYPMYR